MEEYINTVIKALKRKLGEGYQVFSKEQKKNNGIVLHGICIHKEGETIGCVVYPDEFFIPYATGILDAGKIADLLMEKCHPEEVSADAVLYLGDFGRMKEKLRIKLINHDANQERLGHIPYRKFLDLALAYYLEMETDVSDQSASIEVTNELMEIWGVCEDDLYRTGMKKLSAADDIRMTSIFSIVRELAQEAQDEDMEKVLAEIAKNAGMPEMYVVSNRKHHFGAACMLNLPFLRELADSKGCRELHIYPSSVDEFIISPARDGNCDRFTPEDIREINHDSTPNEKRLSNSIYRYDREKQEIFIYRKGMPL